MKTKLVIIIAILLSLLTIVINKDTNDVNNSIITMFNPIKSWYKNTSSSIGNGIEKYIFQATSIEKLRNENNILQKNLLSQKNYIEQSKQIRNISPYLSKLPHNTKIETTQTISYNKMNNFTEVLLTKPEHVTDGIPYGLIENGVVAGVSRMVNDQFYGYLTANEKCRFSVNIGSQKAPGVAIGDGKNGMTIQFIPRSFPINIGDRVTTSGLDGIFYSNLPVGIIRKIEVQSSYKVAYMDTYNDLYHPEIFFVLSGKKPTFFASSNSMKNNINEKSSIYDSNNSLGSPSSLSSTPLIEIDQTKTDTIVPEQAITENKPKPKTKKKIRKPKIIDNAIKETTNNDIETINKPQESETNPSNKDELQINSEQNQPLP